MESPANKVLIEIIVHQALRTLAANFPGFALFFTGALGFVGGYFLKTIVTFLIDKTILGLSLALAKIEIENDRTDYEAAVKKAYDEMRRNPKLTQKQKDDLEQQIIATAKAFIHVRQRERQKVDERGSIDWHGQ